MSAHEREHERERLSAYLDGELSTADTAAVEAHVAACEECAALLAGMAAVDDRFRESPAPAPAGYFDTFAPRVRERIEAEPRRPAARRLPAWTWAAAAALLLAVVTPLTLRGRVSVAPAAAPPPAPAATATAPRESTPEETAAARSAGSGDARAPEPGPVQAEAKAGRTDARPEGQSKAASAPALLDRTAAVHEDESSRRAQGEDRAAAGVPPPSVANAAAGVAGGVEGGVPGGVVGGVVGGTPSEPPAPAARSSTVAPRGTAAAPAAPERERATGVATFGAETSAEVRAKGIEARPASVPPLAEADAVARRADPASIAFARLEATMRRTAEEWRRARADWRAFAAEYAADPRADEARVRAVEAAFEALRASGAEADRRALAGEAAAYLERDDAAQRDRVRGLLRRAEVLPRHQ